MIFLGVEAERIRRKGDADAGKWPRSRVTEQLYCSRKAVQKWSFLRLSIFLWVAQLKENPACLCSARKGRFLLSAKISRC